MPMSGWGAPAARALLPARLPVKAAAGSHAGQLCEVQDAEDVKHTAAQEAAAQLTGNTSTPLRGLLTNSIIVKAKSGSRKWLPWLSGTSNRRIMSDWSLWSVQYISQNTCL